MYMRFSGGYAPRENRLRLKVCSWGVSAKRHPETITTTRSSRVFGFIPQVQKRIQTTDPSLVDLQEDTGFCLYPGDSRGSGLDFSAFHGGEEHTDQSARSASTSCYAFKPLDAPNGSVSVRLEYRRRVDSKVCTNRPMCVLDCVCVFSSHMFWRRSSSSVLYMADVLYQPRSHRRREHGVILSPSSPCGKFFLHCAKRVQQSLPSRGWHPRVGQFPPLSPQSRNFSFSREIQTPSSAAILL